MKSSEQNHTKQLELFFESPILPGKPTVSLFSLPEDTQRRRINHMAKFKPFHEFQKPLTGFTPESFPHLHEDKFGLRRNGTTERPSLQISKRGGIFIRYRSYRGHVFFFRSTYVSSEVALECAFLRVCNRSTQ